MSAAFLNLTEEETRRCKLYHLVVDGGGAVLMYRFDRDIPTPRTYLNDTTVKLELYQLQTKNIISKAQYELLYPSTGAGVTSSKDYDMTLLVALHRTLLCAKKGDPIWHTGNKPAPTDFSVEAEIVRLRDFRNELMHSPKVGGLTEAQFETKWKEVSDVLSRFGSGMPGLQEKLEILKNDCLDKRFEKELLLKLEEWTAMDKAFGDEMMKTLQSNSLSGKNCDYQKRT
ncbi:E3 ubiquitin-protein ligase DZIP3-like [Mercenaria mercenaria]|uniref:E3 ubiquitin-protein ligase DZIP3-like n=1 Tax=Mercenaria mercenaria TaxID=6596 RepID=UPI00234FAC85|nr:E3 ubiquitin-protein ligase DZIP3-like [Mercenaria mercenaria]